MSINSINLSNTIPYNSSKPTNATKHAMWENVIDILNAKHITAKKEISTAVASKYIGDMHGLFQELNITEEHIYPHIRVNGYNNSADYGGETLSIKIIDASILTRYLELISW